EKQLTTQSKEQLKTHSKDQLHARYLTEAFNETDLTLISKQQARFRVPFLIWSNTQKETTTNNTSFNLLASSILRKAQINTSPLFNLTKAIKEHMGEYGKHSKTNTQSELLTDYQL